MGEPEAGPGGSPGEGQGGDLPARAVLELQVVGERLPVPRDGPENSSAPSCPDPRAVAGSLVIFFSSSRVTWKQRGLFVSALGLPCNQKGYGRDHLHGLANSCSSFKTLNSFFQGAFPDSSRLH